MNTMNRSASYSNAKRTNFAASIAVVIGFLLVLPACCIPKLHCAEPAPPLPDTYNGVLDFQNSAQEGWCEFFEDPQLTSLISQALTGNQELKILAQDIRVANYEVMARRGEYLPFVT